MEEKQTVTITLSNTELGELYGMGKPTYVSGLAPENIRLFLGLEKNEYKGYKDLRETLVTAIDKIKFLDKLVPIIEKRIDELDSLSKSK